MGADHSSRGESQSGRGYYRPIGGCLEQGAAERILAGPRTASAGRLYLRQVRWRPAGHHGAAARLDRSQYKGNNPAVFAAQPYEQLADVYRRAGQDSQARKVAIARRTDLRPYGNLNPYRKAGNWFLDKTIKYGYRSWQAGLGLAALFIIFTVLSFAAQQHHLIVPVGNFKGSAPSATNYTSAYRCFYPAGYSVDIVIPIINVHQADNWGPDGAAPWGQAFVIASWVATGAGWALATLLVTGYTGLVRQE